MLERLAAVLVLVLPACGGSAPAIPPAPPSAPPRAVHTASVVALDAEGDFAPGTIVARSRAVLSARTTAAVTALPLREGDRFPSGAVLVRLDHRSLSAAHAAAAAEAAVAEADLRRAEALLARGAATPREAELARARAEAARASVLSAREGLAYAELRAPFAGAVASRPVHVGDVVSPGQPLLEIEGLDGLEVQATVSGAETARLRPGQGLVVTVDGIPAPLAASVRSVSPAGDPGTHRFEVRATLPPAPGLRSGLFARLTLPAAAPSEARLAVPAQALFARGGLAGVYVVSDGRARLRWVAPGAAAGGLTEVRAGLAAGEKVALEPALLEDGAHVVEAH